MVEVEKIDTIDAKVSTVKTAFVHRVDVSFTVTAPVGFSSLDIQRDIERTMKVIQSKFRPSWVTKEAGGGL